MNGFDQRLWGLLAATALQQSSHELVGDLFGLNFKFAGRAMFQMAIYRSGIKIVLFEELWAISQ